MSHRLSQNARHTKELLAELERDKELDVLRDYLTRFELVPSRREPAAPIRFEELKELAKYWKLHRQRNFWKLNTTTDELVRTLYRHIHTKFPPHEGDEEERTQAEEGHDDSNALDPVSEPPACPHPHRSPRVEKAFSSYSGDLFGQRGTYEDGLIYLSRFPKPPALPSSTRSCSFSSTMRESHATLGQHHENGEEEEEEEEKEEEEEEENDDEDISTDILDVRAGLRREIRLKQECGFSIYHFSTLLGHEHQMLDEGCMVALTKLAVVDDTDVKRFCAAAILNLSYDATVSEKLADNGVFGAILELAKAQHEEVRRHTSMALCRFSYERRGQLRLVQEGCVSAIVSMLNVTDMETKEACVKTLINIASSSSASVAESVVHVLMKLATRPELTSATFAAYAICNLSLLSGSRAKVMELGILETICDLTQYIQTLDSKDTGPIPSLLATALCNLSGLPNNLDTLCHARLVTCLAALFQCQNPPQVREFCAVTMANLSSYVPSLKHLASSPAILQLLQQGIVQSNPLVRENTALCLSNLSSIAENRALLARNGIVALLLRILMKKEKDEEEQEREEEDEGVSGLSYQFALLTLCNLLADTATCIEWHESHVLPAVASLATRRVHDRVRDLCANVFFNASCEKTLHSLLLDDTSLRAIVHLCRRPKEKEDERPPFVAPSLSPSTPGPAILLVRSQECAFGCLLNLSFDPSTRAALLQADVVATMGNVFQKPPLRAEDQWRQCAAILANLSFDLEARERIIADHGVRLVRRIMSAALSSASDPVLSASSSLVVLRETLRCCATACCNLAVEAFTTTPVLDMLIDLSNSSHPPTLLLCALAFAKLASHPTHRSRLSRTMELYPALTLMMRCGVDAIQQQAAMAFCHLAMEKPLPAPTKAMASRSVWKDGTVPDFIVNALLRINSETTKAICARALFHLLLHDELRALHVKEGVLYALVKLARLENSDIRMLCVTALYNLSTEASFALDMLLELKLPQIVTKLCDRAFSHRETYHQLAACLANLAFLATTTTTSTLAVKLVEDGALSAILLLLCDEPDAPTRCACAAALCYLSTSRGNCQAMATLGVVHALTKKLLVATDDDLKDQNGLVVKQQQVFALYALCNISCAPELLDRMDEAETVKYVIHVLRASDKEDMVVVLACLETLANVAFLPRHRRAMVTHELIPTILRHASALQTSRQLGEVCAETIAALSEEALHWPDLVASGVVRVLHAITDSHEQETASPASLAALRASIYALTQLARCEKTAETLLQEQALNVLVGALTPSSEGVSLEARQELAERCAIIIRTLSTQGEVVCLRLMQNDRLVSLLTTIVSVCCPGRRQGPTTKHVIFALYNLTSCRVRIEDESDEEGQDKQETEGMRGLDTMVLHGVVPLLIKLSTDGGNETAPACAVALAHIKHRIKERLAKCQAQEEDEAAAEDLLLDPQIRRELEEMDTLMETGVVTALLAMLELDPTGIQRVDRLATALPPFVPVLRAATEKEWRFYRGKATVRYENPVPICWTMQPFVMDATHLVPAEPRTFLAPLSPSIPSNGATLQDKLYGRFQILHVHATKCILRLENSRFRNVATRSSNTTRKSASDLSNAIAMAGGSQEFKDKRRHTGRAARKATMMRLNPGNGEEEMANNETRAPLRTKPTGRALLAMARRMKKDGNLEGSKAGTGGLENNATTMSSRRVSKVSTFYPMGARRPTFTPDNTLASILNGSKHAIRTKESSSRLILPRI